MKRCPITYNEIQKGNYSEEGLKLLSANLNHLIDFPYSAQEQVSLAQDFVLKLSLQGVQPKLSAKLNLKTSSFEVVEKFGTFILKPPHHMYEQVPQNEDLSMTLAQVCGIDVPLHGLIYNKDQSLTYFIKRFDRVSKKKKKPVEDFSQLMGFDRDTKYNSSTEKIIGILENLCSFPLIEKQKFFKLTLFNFLIGNEDMHLKNYSLITTDGITKLSPSYDLINTSIIFKAQEEIALTLNGKKNNLKKQDLIDYLGIQRLSLRVQDIDQILSDLANSLPKWHQLIDISFLSENKKEQYKDVINRRAKRILN
jgi:serine/threonine-protein kinase HipA